MISKIHLHNKYIEKSQLFLFNDKEVEQVVALMPVD